MHVYIPKIIFCYFWGGGGGGVELSHFSSLNSIDSGYIMDTTPPIVVDGSF